ncbi:hypothetical protein C8Q75DRAFT_558798 [Abortiporus biennis]|nr:hypothetical protein C8Q75DRAFT_558798 [Abortiporus biennis]
MKSLSDDKSIEYILADIPMFADGILALAILTFFCIMGRVNRVLLCLNVAVILAFLAALFDLAQNLSRGRLAVDNGTGIASVFGLLIARDVFFSLSFGFRFLFLWGFVAQPPPGESVEEDGVMHSGAWGRWGFLGTVLKWVLAALCVAIPVLQILYRCITAFSQFGPIYEVENAMAIIVSALLILKLFLNLYLVGISGKVSRIRTFLCYLPMILAIMLGLSISIGNMLEFLYSETVLARFLQGIELYTFILYLAVTTFYRSCHKGEASNSDNRNRSSSFYNMSRSAMFGRESFFQFPTTNSTMFLSLRRPSENKLQQTQPPIQVQSEKPPRPSVVTNPSSSISAAAQKIPNWMIPRRLSQRLDDLVSPESGARLWNQDEAERGLSPGPTELHNEIEVKASASRTSFDQSPMEPKESARWQDPVFTSVLKEAADEILPTSSPLSPSVSSSPLLPPPRIYSQSPDSTRTDSPVFGLDGITNKPRVAAVETESVQPRNLVIQSPQDGFESSRSSVISQLFRQQAELDKSIASLRLLSQRTNAAIAARESVEGARTSSVAASDFSLSNFPQPPWRRSNDTEATERFSELVPTTKDAPGMGGDTVVLEPESMDLRPPVMPAASSEHSRSLSVPFSDNDNPLLSVANGRSIVNSEGTQYEITSFIGDLMHPAHKKNMSTSQVSQASAASFISMASEGSQRTVRVATRAKPVLSIVGPPNERGRVIGLPPRPKLSISNSAPNSSPLAERISSPDSA